MDKQIKTCSQLNSCSYCINSHYLKSCNLCIFCLDCIRCIDCISCSYSKNLWKCSYCVNCENCTNLAFGKNISGFNAREVIFSILQNLKECYDKFPEVLSLLIYRGESSTNCELLFHYDKSDNILSMKSGIKINVDNYISEGTNNFLLNVKDESLIQKYISLFPDEVIIFY